MKSQTLECKYDRRKSFYGKALVIYDDEGRIWLRSYQTDVAVIENGKVKVFSTYSVTTLRHIKEFLLQHGFKAIDKKQITNDYMVVEK